MAFKYKERSKESAEKRKNQQGTNRDPMFKDGITIFKPKDKENRIRFLPPTWTDSDHYGFDLFVHYGIGGEKASYACNKIMRNEDDPICIEAELREKEGDADSAKKIKAKKRVLVYVIDRDNEEAGPQLWPMPWTLDRDIAVLATDDTTGEILLLDKPDAGWDVIFSKKGTLLNTEYYGIKIARKETPLSASDKTATKWLEFIEKNPIPETIIYYPFNYLEKVFSGTTYENKEDDPELNKEEKEEQEEKDVVFTYDSILELSEDELKELAVEQSIPSFMIKKMDYDELVSAVCESLDITIPEPEEEKEPEPEKKKEPEKKEDIKERLKAKLAKK